jgi:hypothetical protein
MAFGLLEVVRGEVLALVAIVLGAGGTSLGLFFGRVAWTGRVPASIEEIDLDQPEIEEHRQEARAQGLLEE